MDAQYWRCSYEPGHGFLGKISVAIFIQSAGSTVIGKSLLIFSQCQVQYVFPRRSPQAFPHLLLHKARSRTQKQFSLSPTTYNVSDGYLQMRSALCSALLFMPHSLISSSVEFCLFLCVNETKAAHYSRETFLLLFPWSIFSYCRRICQKAQNHNFIFVPDSLKSFRFFAEVARKRLI